MAKIRMETAMAEDHVMVKLADHMVDPQGVVVWVAKMDTVQQTTLLTTWGVGGIDYIIS